MNCRKVNDLLGPYLYEDLKPRERELVERHTLECEQCRRDLEAFKAIVNRIPADLFLPHERTRKPLKALCQEALRQSEGDAPLPWDAVLGNRLVQVGIAAVLFFALGIWGGQQIGKPASRAAPRPLHRLDAESLVLDWGQPGTASGGARASRVESKAAGGRTGHRPTRRARREANLGPQVTVKAKPSSPVEAPRGGGVDDARLAGRALAVPE